MNWVEVRIRPLAPFRTPWRNDTIWGRLTWAVAEGVLLPKWNIEQWIEAYRSDQPPLVVGDGFSLQGFPLPAAWRAMSTPDRTKLPDHVPMAEFLRLAREGTQPTKYGQQLVVASSLHVSLSRETGTAVEGSLRVEDALTTPDQCSIAVLSLVSQELTADDLLALWDHLACEGWGKRRSVGYGAFSVEKITQIEAPNSGNAFVTLGHCLPTDDLPNEGLWRLSGIKLLPHDPATGSPVMPELFTVALKPGACFRETPQRQWAGRMLWHPLNGHPNYTRYGLTPAWPINWPD